MPVKQAEISSWRREARVGVGVVGGGADGLDLAIDIFVGLEGESSGGMSGLETGKLGNGKSPAAVETGGALGHAQAGWDRDGHGIRGDQKQARRHASRGPESPPRIAIRWEGARDKGQPASRPREPLFSRGWSGLLADVLAVFPQHPRLRANVPEPVMNRGNPAEVFHHVLLAN